MISCACPWLKWIEQRTPDPQIEGSSPFGHAKSMHRKKCSLRIDCDTKQGLETGVLKISELLFHLNIKASFFIVTGPFDYYLSISRIFTEKGFLKKLLHLNRSYLNLSSKNKINKIAIVEKILSHGHEVGLHGYSHFRWIRDFLKWTDETASIFFTKGVSDFKETFGYLPKFSAAPGWRMNFNLLQFQESFNFNFASDIRANEPFYPLSANGEILKTPQIPVTRPTLDEILIYRGKFPFTLENGDVYCAHAELEGMNYINIFQNFLEINLRNGCEFVKMSEILKPSELRTKKILLGAIKGRTGKIAVAK